MKNSSTPLWIELLPDKLKGGPRSNFQKRLREQSVMAQQPANSFSSIATAPEAPIGGMARGGGVRKRMAQSMPKSMKPMMGMEAGGYTGDDGEAVQADSVNEVKTFKDHDGEYYVNAPMVGILGGPDAVEKLITDFAQKCIAVVGGSGGEGKPIVSKDDPVKNMIPTSNIRTSFGPGGAVGEVEDVVGSGTGIQPAYTQADVDWDNRQLSGSVPMGSTPASAKPANFNPNNAATTPIGLAGQANLGSQYLGVEIPKAIKLGKILTGKNNTSTGSDISPISAPSGAGRAIRTGLDSLTSMAQGDNPVLDGIINTTLQKFGANTAAGKAELQMRLSQQGITGPAADAAMETYDRNARVNQSQIQSTLAQEGMQQSQTAASTLLTEGQKLKASENDQKTTAMAAALAAGNFGEYARLYREVNGSNIDTANIEAAYNDGIIDSVRASLYTDIAADGALSITDPNVVNRLKRLWTATGGQGEPTPAWLNDEFNKIKATTDPYYQYKNSMSDEAILEQWFGNDSSKLERFGYNGQTGMNAVRALLPRIFQEGISRTTDPTTGKTTFTVKADAGVWDLIFPEDQPGVTYTDAYTPPAEGSTSFTANGRNYSLVTGLGTAAAPTFVMSGGKLYKSSIDSTGKIVIEQTPVAPEVGGDGRVMFAGRDTGITRTGTEGNYIYKKNGAVVVPDFNNIGADGMPTTSDAPKASASWTTPPQARAGFSNSKAEDYSAYKTAVGTLSLALDREALKFYADAGNAKAIQDYADIIATNAGISKATTPEGQQQLVDSQDSAKMVGWTNKFIADPTVLLGGSLTYPTAIPPSSPFYQAILGQLLHYDGTNAVVGGYVAIDPTGTGIIAKSTGTNPLSGHDTFKGIDGSSWEWDGAKWIKYNLPITARNRI